MGRILLDAGPLRRHRHFRRLWAGQAVSSIGSQLTVVAVSFQAYSLTHSTLDRGFDRSGDAVSSPGGVLVGGRPGRLHGPASGTDLAQVVMATASGGLVADASLPHPELWPLFVCTAIGAGFQGVDWPARRAALPALVSDEDVTAAVALQTTIGQLALVAGPALGGILIAAFGLGAVYGIDVATYGCAPRCRRLLPRPRALPRRPTGITQVGGGRLSVSLRTQRLLVRQLLGGSEHDDLRHAPCRVSGAGHGTLWRRSRGGRIAVRGARGRWPVGFFLHGLVCAMAQSGKGDLRLRRRVGRRNCPLRGHSRFCGLVWCCSRSPGRPT